MASSTPKKIICGVIGAGGNTKLRHIPEILKIQGVEIKTIANRTVGSARAVAEQFGIQNASGDWRDVINDPDIDAVIIGTWPYMHCQLVVKALENNKHVLCEARMSMNAQEAHAMLRAQRAHPHLTAQIVPSPYTLAFDSTIQDILKSGTFGTIVSIRVKGVTGAYPDAPYSPLSWRQNFTYSGFNILSMGIIYEALARWVGGAKKVMAMSQTVTNMRTDPETGLPKAVIVPDHVDIIAQMHCGAQANMTFSAVCGGDPGPVHEIWLFGTQGSLRLNVDEGQLELSLNSEKEEERRLHHVDGHGDVNAGEQQHHAGWRVEREFINAIRGLEPVRLTDFATAVEYMEFTEAVAQSCQSGRAVSLPLIPRL